MFEVKPQTRSIGAEIRGLDLSQPLEASDRAALRQAWFEHLVLVFPDQQRVTPEQHIAFGRSFGTLEVESSLNAFSHPQHREIFLLTNEVKDGKASDTRNVGWQWHTDLTYSTQPSAGAVMHAMSIPDAGGDTLFANMYAAYETLSPTLRDILKGLWAIHDNANSQWYAKRDAEATKAFTQRNLPVRQPMVRMHPETGRAALLLNECTIRQICGMTEAESAPLLGFLNAHATKPEFTYRHRWRTGDILIWDNRCTMHKVVADHDERAEPGSTGKLRLMHRVTLRGTPSGERLNQP